MITISVIGGNPENSAKSSALVAIVAIDITDWVEASTIGSSLAIEG